MENLMEEEVQTREKPKHKEEMKLTKPRASINIMFEVFAFTTPLVQVGKTSEDFSSSDEDEDQVSKKTKVDDMEVTGNKPLETKKRARMMINSKELKENSILVTTKRINKIQRKHT